MPTPKPKPRTKAQSNQSAKERISKSKKTAAQEKQEYKKKLSDLIDAECLRLEIDDYRIEKVVKKVTGVGNYKDWSEETENQFVNTAPSQPKSEATEPTRPKLKKLSKRKQRKNKVLDKK